MTDTVHLLVMAKDPVPGRVKTRLESFTAAGGQILVCTPCAKTRGVALDNLIAAAAPRGRRWPGGVHDRRWRAASVSY